MSEETKTKVANDTQDEKPRLARIVVRLSSLIGLCDVRNLEDTRNRLWNLRSCIFFDNSTRSRIKVAGVVYHCSYSPAVFKLGTWSLWDRLHRDLGKEHKVEIDELYQDLKAYVEPVALEFMSAK